MAGARPPPFARLRVGSCGSPVPVGASFDPLGGVLNNDDCSGLPPADPGVMPAMAGRWWIAHHPPRLLA